MTYSKVPPLGIDYVYEWAALYAEQKMYPRTFKISPPGMLGKTGQISGVSQNLFLDRLYLLWPEAVNAVKTPWMENAYKRYVKWKAKEVWKNLPGEQRNELVKEALMRGIRGLPEDREKLRLKREVDEILRNCEFEREAERRRLEKWRIEEQGRAERMRERARRQWESDRLLVR